MTTYTDSMPRSTLRHRPIGSTRSTNIVTPRTSAHPSRVLGRSRPRHSDDDNTLIDQLTRQPRTYDTDQDEQVAPSTRAGYRQQAMIQPPPQGRSFHPRNWHPAVWVCVTLLAVLIGSWASTSGLAWWNNTLVNPAKYGPAQGQVATGVFGGGDSQSQPSKLIAMNNNGRVEILLLHANDPGKSAILVGPDLTAVGFPDPSHAHVDLQIGDFDHSGNESVQVTVVSTVYDKPFYPFAQQYTLYGDGQGNLKQRQQ